MSSPSKDKHEAKTEVKADKPDPDKKYLDYEVWKTATEWSKDPRCLVSLDVLQARLDKGWSTRHALTVCLIPGEK
jgi:hypothetical protein